MTKILLWDPRFPARDPAQVDLAPAVASALVRSGVATTADPGQAGALASGGALDPGSPTEVVIEEGPLRRLLRLVLPASAATIAVAAGIAAAIGTSLSSGPVNTLPVTTLAKAVALKTLNGVDVVAASAPLLPIASKAGVDRLPDGCRISGALIRFDVDQSYDLRGWDLRGFTVYAERGTIDLSDTKLGTSDGTPAVDIRGTTSVIMRRADGDGGSYTGKGDSLVKQTSNTSTLLIEYCRFHHTSDDAIMASSNCTVRGCLFYLIGFNLLGHADAIQTLTGSAGAVTVSNVLIEGNVFDGDAQANVVLNNAVRAVAEQGASHNNITVRGNVVGHPNTMQPPFVLGRRISPAGMEGVSATNFTFSENLLSYAESSGGPLYLPTNEAPTGGAAWSNNRKLSDNSLIPPQTGWGVSMLPYVLLDGFDDLTGRTVPATVTQSIDTSARKTLGAGALRLQGVGTNGSQSASKTALTSLDFGTQDIVVLWTDLPDDVAGQDLIAVRPQLRANSTTYSPQVDTANGGGIFNNFTPDSRGKIAQSFKLDRIRAGSWSGAKITDQGAVSKDSVLFVGADGGWAEDAVVDAMVLPSPHKPIWIPTFDDINRAQYTDLFPVMQARGIVGTLYVPTNLIGRAASLTMAMLHEMQNAGWCIALDSDPEDAPLTKYATPAAAVSQLNAMKAILNAEFGNADGGLDHLCYSFGRSALLYAPQGPYTVTPNGTDTVTLPTNIPYQTLAPGMVVKGPSVPAGTTVLECLSITQVKLSQAVPSGSAESWTFIGRSRGVTVTCNGSTTVVVSSTATLAVGQTMTGYSVPANTTITAIVDGTTLTMSAAVPSTCGRANFDLKTSPFFGGKMPDALIAAGYKSARKVASGVGTGVYTGYGIDPKLAMQLPSMNHDLTSAAGASTLITNLEAAFAARLDVCSYGHVNGTFSMQDWITVLDYAAARRSAGERDILGVGDWGRRVATRLPIA